MSKKPVKLVTKGDRPWLHADGRWAKSARCLSGLPSADFIFPRLLWPCACVRGALWASARAAQQ
jgi:hypothetical protein